MTGLYHITSFTVGKVVFSYHPPPKIPSEILRFPLFYHTAIRIVPPTLSLLISLNIFITCDLPGMPWTSLLFYLKIQVKVLAAQACLTLCLPMDCSPLGSSVHGILQAGILGWASIPFSRGSSWPSDRSRVPCTGKRILYSLRHLGIPLFHLVVTYSCRVGSNEVFPFIILCTRTYSIWHLSITMFLTLTSSYCIINSH